MKRRTWSASPTYADYSLATKMADSPEQVIRFLRELAAHSRSAAEKEYTALSAFAGIDLEPWDVTFWLEKYKQAKFSISNEELRQYFPADTVINGLFALAAKLYDVELAAETASRPGTRMCAISRSVSPAAKSSAVFIRTCLRETASAPARGSTSASAASNSTELDLPVGYLVCNFPPPDDDGQSLLTHDDVVTLFHEFGHMLHHLLTRIGFPSISGINGVPWDAVELPSQFMENFAWSYEVLTHCSSHARSGEPLPRELFDKLDKSRHAGAALAMMRQLELGLYDFRLHAEYDPQNRRAYLRRWPKSATKWR